MWIVHVAVVPFVLQVCSFQFLAHAVQLHALVCSQQHDSNAVQRNWYYNSRKLPLNLFCKFIHPMSTVFMIFQGICIIYDVIIADKILPADLLKALRLKYSYGEVRNFVLSKRSLLGRCTVLALAGVLLVLLRFRIMGFSQPTFKAVDNPASFLDNFFLRILNYNYIYSLNLWLLLCPEWLCFDWSMGCVPLINGINPRVGFIILLWFVLGAFVMIVFSERDHQLTRYNIFSFKKVHK